MPKDHRYQVTVTWIGNPGEGTTSYRSYDRDNEVSAEHLTSQVELAERLPAEANASCFLASSLNLPVQHRPSTLVRPAD